MAPMYIAHLADATPSVTTSPCACPAGVRYLFAGRAFEGRPSYHILGILLLAQLCLSGALWGAQRLGGLPTLLRWGLPGGAAGGQQQGKPRHAVLLEVRPCCLGLVLVGGEGVAGYMLVLVCFCCCIMVVAGFAKGGDLDAVCVISVVRCEK